MKVEMSAEPYQVGAHLKALIKAILVVPLKSFERFFRISSSPAGLCGAFQTDPFGWAPTSPCTGYSSRKFLVLITVIAPETFPFAFMSHANKGIFSLITFVLAVYCN